MIFNNEILITSSLTGQYYIYSDSKKYHTVFRPDDLLCRNENSITVIPELERVFENRKKDFLRNLRFVSGIRMTSEISNSIPDYVNIYEKNGTVHADSTYYDADVLDPNADNIQFFQNLRAICNSIRILTEETGTEPFINLESIVFEKSRPWLLHFLHIDFFSHDTKTLRNQLRDAVIFRIYGRKPKYADFIGRIRPEKTLQPYHPKMLKLLRDFLNIISPVKSAGSDWNDAYRIADEICLLLKENHDYFLNPYFPEKNYGLSYTQEINDGYVRNGHIVFLQGENKSLLESIANQYVIESQEKYLHVIKSSAKYGLLSMLESNTFALHSDVFSASEILKKLKILCKDGLLLIITDCNIESDRYFKNILKLPADILILTEKDYAEYGFCTIHIKE